jgi:hypothetical protein
MLVVGAPGAPPKWPRGTSNPDMTRLRVDHRGVTLPLLLLEHIFGGRENVVHGTMHGRNLKSVAFHFGFGTLHFAELRICEESRG